MPLNVDPESLFRRTTPINRKQRKKPMIFEEQPHSFSNEDNEDKDKHDGKNEDRGDEFTNFYMYSLGIEKSQELLEEAIQNREQFSVKDVVRDALHYGKTLYERAMDEARELLKDADLLDVARVTGVPHDDLCEFMSGGNLDLESLCSLTEYFEHRM